VLSHKTYQNQGICHVTIAYCYATKTCVAHNKFPHVNVARNTKKVGQAWSTKTVDINLRNALFGKNCDAVTT